MLYKHFSSTNKQHSQAFIFTTRSDDIVPPNKVIQHPNTDVITKYEGNKEKSNSDQCIQVTFFDTVKTGTRGLYLIVQFGDLLRK
jgi:hypothetical protein